MNKKLIWGIIIIIISATAVYAFSSKNRLLNPDPASGGLNVPSSDFKTYTGSNFSVKYASTWVYLKYSCNIEGIAFWPKADAPVFPVGNSCPMSIVNTAPIVVTTEGAAQLVINDKKYPPSQQFVTLIKK